MHPALPFLLCLSATVAVQWLSWPFLLLLGVALACGGKAVLGRWRGLLRRCRWLLLTLWLVMAYGAPGDAWLGIAWMPTEAGLDLAAGHVLRLVVSLGALAWMFERLDRQALVSALWFLFSPLMAWGIDVRAAVVRVFLVFSYVESSPPADAWRSLLDDKTPPAGPSGVVTLCLPPWRGSDTLRLLGGLALLALGVIAP